MGKRNGDWMQTYTGLAFWPIDPRPEDVSLIDIAHSLSMLCRYGGHSTRFYSVAEHSCHVHDALPDEFKAWGLMHDASEAYCADVPRPLKPYLLEYKQFERQVMNAVCDRFGMDRQEPSDVKVVDTRILGDEQRQAMSTPPMTWPSTGDPLGIELQFWLPSTAKAEFLGRASALGLV